jgi:hypothetical protein
VCDPLFTVPVPPPTVAHDGFTASLLAATDDGHLLLQRAVTINAISFPDAIVSLTADGFPAWTFATDATQVAAAGDTVVTTTTGTNQATKAIVALDGLTGAVKMTADAPDVRLDGPLIVAGGLIYVEGSDPSGTKVDIFPTDCAQPTCSRLRALDTGPAQDGFSGMSESEATLFVAKAGPDGLQAFALTG